MDGDISRWVLEFLLRSSVPDSLIKKTITVLPLSGGNSRLKKTLLLRTLQSQLSKASLTETVLEILELIEDLDQNDAVPVTDAARHAYCSVAVECTVKYLAASPDDAGGEYFAAVGRIWRGRVREMEAAAGRRSELISGELTRWRDEIEAALWDPRVCERLANLNSRRDALNKVKVYLKEAWEIMGPSFLDSVAALSKGKGLRLGNERGEVGAEGQREGRNVGVCEFAFAAEPMSKYDGRLESSANAAAAACCMNKEQLEERIVSSVDGNQELGGCDDLPAQGERVQKSNLLLKRKHSALRRCHRGVKISGDEEVGLAKPYSKYDPLPSPKVKKVRESLKSSYLELRALVRDPLPDALHTSEVVRSRLAMKDINHEPPIENQSGDVDVPDPDVCKSIVLFQPNDANLGKKSSVHCSNVHHPNLMERKSTARTYEWDDSIDNLPRGTQPRRRKRKWTPLEEEKLRAGVQMFGEGNWATIRNFYSNIFEKRSGVDLKDKWRNMIR